MEIEKYLKGIGLDVSRGKKSFVELDNFYTLKGFCDYESQDYIYSKNLVNETKFWRILIKEWLNFCKVGGHIVIEMKSNKLLDFPDLLKEVEVLAGEKGKIVDKEYSSERRSGIVVLKKTKPVLVKGDSIDNWSFGIISGGTTDMEVDRAVDSIISLGIPEYEIIISGFYGGKYSKKRPKNVRLLPFDHVLPWITRKKNLICEAAKYENLAIIHDKFSFEKDWHEGMKKYGNYFEILGCTIRDTDGRRAQDWVTYGIPLRPFSKLSFTGGGGNLEDRDWDRNINIGGFALLKKSVWKECPWDERLLLFQTEDMKISGDFYAAGFVPRFNPHANAKAWRPGYGEYQLRYKFNKKKLGRPTSPSMKTLITFYLKRILYRKFGCFLSKPDYDLTQRTLAIPMKSYKNA
ncbi:MAG: hypothetical protein ABIG28_00020 [archaeon]